MKTTFNNFAAALGVALMATLLTATATAGCGDQYLNPGASLHRQSWDTDATHPSLLLAQYSNDPIVGMWQVKFTAQGNTGPKAPPDGTPIDSALVVWHNDGTEIMNSGRPAQDGNFCMGVWEKTGRVRYKLNHFALGNDTANAPSGVGNPAGPTHIVETVVLSSDANSYAGNFTLNAYNTAGKRTAHIVGVIAATRITVSTPIQSLF
jgi:hypothetical protein